MDAATVERLENSFRAIAPRGPDLMDLFYRRLFETAPGVRHLFPEDMRAQRQALLGALARVIEGVRDLDALVPVLEDLGARHVGYGAVEAHYPVVRDTMLTSMAEVAGDGWDATLEADWRAALDLVAGVMIRGAAAN